MEDPLIFPFTYIVNIFLIDTSCFLLPPTPWVFSMVGYYILRVITPFMMKVLLRNSLFRWIFASAVVLCTYLAFGFRLLVCSVLLFYLWYFLIYLMCIVCLSALLCSFANCFCYDSSIFGPFDYMWGTKEIRLRNFSLHIGHVVFGISLLTLYSSSPFYGQCAGFTVW